MVDLIDLPDSVLSRITFHPTEDVIIPALRSKIPDISFQSEISHQQDFPFVLIRRAGSFGFWGGDPRFVDVAVFTIWVYTEDPDGDEKGALISEAIRTALMELSAENHYVPNKGWIGRVTFLTAPRRATDWNPSSGPVQYADLPTAAWRYEYMAEAVIRRPLT